MGFSLEEFVELRPYMYLYHLTAESNIQRILALGKLKPAADLLHAGGRDDLLDKKRENAVTININGETVHIRDQKPLIEKNIEFTDGCSLERFIELLNRHVFFWPGGENGPNKSGREHWGRYKTERPVPVILRFSSDVLLTRENRGRVRVCKFNSGAPRCRNGRRSPRGEETFVDSKFAKFTKSRTVEVVLKGPLILSGKIWIGKTPGGPWKLKTTLCP